ncbi:MAG: class I SAM-dependent methyltransferase [Candidatus Electrothrix sp. Rat3]|nr:class I SAM-dependent methyltransferase [Candidatus Electrothrix rattekaaiensis]
MTKQTNSILKEKSSFRDPSGYLFVKNGDLYRLIKNSYQKEYVHLCTSGLYEKLTNMGLLISHDEITESLISDPACYKIIKPVQIPFISYPYEWSFSQLRDAALLTLRIQRLSLKKGMSLKDASSYNIQFQKGQPIFIDTLSFELHQEGKPWVAYKQFCEHFLSPLLLMSYTDIRLNQLATRFIDGIPLDLSASLLPFRARFNVHIFFHIIMHSKLQKKYENKTVDCERKKVSNIAMLGIFDSLAKLVSSLRPKSQDTEWGDYYSDINYDETAFQYKKELLKSLVHKCEHKMIWDLGANTGFFSRIAGLGTTPVISFDIDPVAVEKNYRMVKRNKEENILPLVLDLTNPSPGIGWSNHERKTISERNLPETVLALALIHHLAISNNIPLQHIASFFYGICKNLIVEFIPKEDSQVQRLLATREDIFPGYTMKEFERIFSEKFFIIEKCPVKNTKRTFYLMKIK